ncbi:MAG: ATP-binding protein [Sumerlaeia bacterium]
MDLTNQNTPEIDPWHLSQDWHFRLSGSFVVKELNQSARVGLQPHVRWSLDDPWSLLKIATQGLLDFLNDLLRSAKPSEFHKIDYVELTLQKKICKFKGRAAFRTLPSGKHELMLSLQDFTDFYDAQEKMQLQLNCLRSWQSTSRDVIFSFDRTENRFTFFSNSIDRYSHYRAEELVENAQLFWNQIPTDDHLALRDFLLNDDGLIGSSLFRFSSEHKPLAWFQIKMNETKRTPTKIEGIFSDITLEKEQNEKSKFQERLINSFLYTSPTIMGVVEKIDDDLKILFISSSAAKQFGVPTNRLRGKFLRGIHPQPNAVDQMLPFFVESRTLHKPVEFVVEPLKPVDVVSRYIVNFIQTTAEGHDVFSVLGISVHKTGESIWAHSLHEQPMQHILEEFPVMVWSTDRNLVYTSVVGNGLGYIQKTAQDFVGKKIKESYPYTVSKNSPLDADEIVEKYKSVLLGGIERFDFECFDRYLRCFLRPLLDESKTIQGVLGVSLDITEFHDEEKTHQQLTVQMQESQRLESLGILAGGIAHDYNNLLTGITGSLSLIQTAEELPQSLREYFHQIESSTQQMVGLTHQMLSYSGKAQPNFKVLDLNDLIEDSLNMIRSMIQGSFTGKLRIEKNLTNFPLYVRVDETQIQQVILNLLNNAREAITSTEGTIRITTRKQKISQATINSLDYATTGEEGAYAKVIIEDDGVGMEEGVRQRIFEPFYTTKFTGRGLGLSSVHGIMKSHKGLVRVESEKGKGSRFFISLPISEETSSSVTVKWNQKIVTPIPHNVREGKVLIIDDEQMILDISTKVLKKLGFDSITANTGEEGLEIYRAKKADITLIMLDVTMPGMSGRDVLEELYKIGYAQPLILMSGFSEQEIRAKIKSQIPIHFLSKPFRIETLKSVLVKVQDEHSGVDENP